MDRRKFLKASAITAAGMAVSCTASNESGRGTIDVKTRLESKESIKEPARRIPVVDSADIVVVGGGPAGSMSAVLLAKNRDVTVLEDHPVSGTPLQCTGLVSPDVIGMSGVSPTVLNSFSRLNVHFPDGFVYPVDCGETKAVLSDRSELDRLMAERAMDAGAEYLYSERCTSCDIGKGSVRTATSSGKEFTSEMVIGADGH